MRGCGEEALPAKECFISHAVTWMNPKVAALALLDEDGPSINPQRLSVREPDVEHLLWTNRPVKSFLNASSASSPCLTRGSTADWRAFKNNNMPCERLIGQMKYCILKKKFIDSQDYFSDDELSRTDKRIREYVNYAFY